MHGGISDRGIILYRPRVALALFRAPANQRSAGVAGVSKPCAAVSIRGTSVFVPALLELYMSRETSEPGMRPYRPRVALALLSSPNQSAIGRSGWGFHTVRGGFNPGGHFFAPGGRSCRYTEAFPNRGWRPIVPG